jgi:hypothetical protein
VKLYVVQYTTVSAVIWGPASPDSNVKTLSQSLIPKDPGNTETFIFTASTGSTLYLGATYYFAIFSQDSSGLYSDVSVSVSTRTKEGTSPGQIANLTAMQGTYKGQVNLTWTAIGDDDAVGTATSYVVKYASFSAVLEDATTTWWSRATAYTQSWTPKAAGQSESYTLSSLPLNLGTTEFWFGVTAKDEYASEGAVSNVVSTTTLPSNSPSQIIDLTAMTTTYAGGIVLTWTAPGDEPTPTTRAAMTYWLRYRNDVMIEESNFAGATIYGSTWPPAAPGTVETKVITGFLPGTTYYFGIKAVDEYGNAGALSTGTVSAYAGPASPISATKGNDANGLTLHAGQTFTVEGVVISTWGQASSSSYFIVDETGGIIVYNATTKTYVLGDKIRATGKIKSYYSAVEFDPVASTALVSSSNTIPAPILINCNVLAANSANGNDGAEVYESKLVRVNGVTTADTFATGASKTLTDSSGSTVLYINAAGGEIDGSPTPSGKFDAIGVCGQHGASSTAGSLTGYQIYPRTTLDIIDVIDNLIAQQGNGAVNLLWLDSNDPNRTGYKIYWSSVSASASFVNTSTSAASTAGNTIEYTVAPLENNVTYWFYVNLLQSGTDQAKQPALGESSASNIVQMWPSLTPVIDVTPPGAITTLTAAPLEVNSSNSNAGKVTLTWIAPTQDGTCGGPVYSYILKYATFGPITEANFDSMNTYTQSLSPKTTGFLETLTLVGLGNGVTYYFNIKSVDSYSNKSSTSNVTSTYSTPYLVVSILTARGYADGTTGVAIQGVITSLYDTSADFGNFMQDGTAGIDLYSTPLSMQSAVVGDEYMVIGNVTSYNGLKEITGVGSNYLFIGSGRTVTPVVVTCNELATNGELYEGQLIKILNVTTSDSFPDSGKGKTMTITDNTGSVKLDADSTVKFGSYAGKKPGGSFTIIGNGGQYDTTSPYTESYQITPRGATDIEGDVTAPSEVQISVDNAIAGEGGLVLFWPAPSDLPDNFHGTTAVSKYKIRYSINPQTLYGAASTWWDAATELTRVLPANLSGTVIGSTIPVSGIVPKQPGVIEQYIVLSPDVVMGNGYYFGIKAIDEAGNESAISYVTSPAASLWVNGLNLGKTDLGDRMTVFSSGTFVTRRYVVNYGDADEGVAPTLSAAVNWVQPNSPVSFVGYTSGRTGITPFGVNAAAVIGSTITIDANGSPVPTTANASGGIVAFNIPDAPDGSKYESIDIIATVYGYTYVMTRWNDISAPVTPDSTKFTTTLRTPGSDDQDQVSGEAGAAEPFSTVVIYSKDLSSLTTKTLRDQYTVNKTTALANGSFPATNVGLSQYRKLYVCAKDPAGNKSSAASAFLLQVNETKLYQPGPNPFKLDASNKAVNGGKMTIWYDLKDSARVTIKIFNVAGEYITNQFLANGANVVKTAFDEFMVAAGGSYWAQSDFSEGFKSDQKGTNWSPQWDGTNDSGNDVASGVYIIYFKAGAYETTKKIVLIR